jgi:NADPH-dependent curcumin reductase CurA
MATGEDTFEGLGLPRLGSYQQEQQAVADDMVTLTGKASMSGDFIVCENSAGTELFIVNVDGDIEATDLVASGDVQSATLTCTGIGTFQMTTQTAGTAEFAVAGLTTNDVVVLSPASATDGACVVDFLTAGTLTIRNVASEAATVKFNYLVIAKA